MGHSSWLFHLGMYPALRPTQPPSLSSMGNEYQPRNTDSTLAGKVTGGLASHWPYMTNSVVYPQLCGISTYRLSGQYIEEKQPTLTSLHGTAPLLFTYGVHTLQLVRRKSVLKLKENTMLSILQ